MPSRTDVEYAETLARRRARLLPLLGIALIVGNALVSGEAPPPWPARAVWLAVFITGFLLVICGGAWPGRLRALIEDETTRDARRAAIFTGYCAGVACLLGMFVLTCYIALSATQVIEVALATIIAAPLIAFGARERAALRGE